MEQDKYDFTGTMRQMGADEWLVEFPESILIGDPHPETGTKGKAYLTRVEAALLEPSNLLISRHVFQKGIKVKGKFEINEGSAYVIAVQPM